MGLPGTSAGARPRSLLLCGVLAIVFAISGAACGSAALKNDGGAGASGKGGAGGSVGRGGTGGASSGTGGAAGGAPECVLDSTQIDNCVLK